jgi:hypothetical protein
MFSHDLVRREEFLRSPPAPHPGRILFVRRTGDVIPGYIPASLRLAERCRHGKPDSFCLSRRDGGRNGSGAIKFERHPSQRLAGL